MNKFVWLLAIVGALALARPSLAQQGGERYVTHTYRSSFRGFRYRPLSFQIEGGPTFSEGATAKQDLAGGGYYDRRDSFYRAGLVNGIFCGWYFCFEGPVQVGLRVGDQTTGMRFEKNAGVGLEFALSRTTSFFVDARYMRFTHGGQNLDFIPLRFGLRF